MMSTAMRTARSAHLTARVAFVGEIGMGSYWSFVLDGEKTGEVVEPK
jgi:hypothetical protein